MFFFCITIIECIHQTCSLHGNLRHTIYDGWFSNPRGFKYRRCYINHMTKLISNLTFCFNSCRPVNDCSVPCTTKVTSNLLCESKRCIKRDCPTDRHMRIGLTATPFIKMRKLLFNCLLSAIKHVAPVPVPCVVPLCTGTVITRNINNKSVIGLSKIIDCTKEPTYLMIRILCKGCKNLCLPSKYFLLIFF